MEKLATQDSKMYKVLKCNAVAMWVYDSVTDSCSICKNPLREACIKCQADQETFDQNKCKKVVGKCNHCYHEHCIEGWVKKQNTCPLDNSDWEVFRFLE
jgi:RING-box protein 1